MSHKEQQNLVKIKTNRFVAGFGEQGRPDAKLLIKKSENSDKAVIYSCAPQEYSDYQVYVCKCRKKALSRWEDDERVVKADDGVEHTCNTVSYRVQVLELKKRVLFFGTPEEVEHWEKATDCPKLTDSVYEKVQQRNWCFVDRHREIIVRSESDRQLARRFVCQLNERHQKKVYVCPDCPQAALVIQKSAMGVLVVFQPPSEIHGQGCRETDVAKLAKDNGYEIADLPNMDIYRLVPESDWNFTETGQMAVRDASNPSRCSIYSKKSKTPDERAAPSKNWYMCNKCRSPFYAWQMMADQRVVAPRVTHSHTDCPLKTFPSRTTNVAPSSSSTAGNEGVALTTSLKRASSVGAPSKERSQKRVCFSLDNQRREDDNDGEDARGHLDESADDNDEENIEITASDEQPQTSTSPSKKLYGHRKPQQPVLEPRFSLAPSESWLKNSPFGSSSTYSGYKVWASLRRIDLNSQELPPLEKVQHFESGFSLISHLFTGTHEITAKVKKLMGIYLFHNYKNLGIVDNVDCSKLGIDAILDMMFAEDLARVHLTILSKMLDSNVILFDYEKGEKFVVKNGNDEATNVVAGFDAKGYFLFLDN